MNDDTSRSRAAVVADHLRHLVAQTSPGQTLPSVRELSRTLSASPVTIGRVVAELAAQGLVVVRPGRGTVVAPGRTVAVADVSWQPMALPPAAVDPADVAPLDPGSVAAGLGAGISAGTGREGSAGASAGVMVLSSGYLTADLQPRQALAAAAARSVRRGATWAPAPAAGLPELRELFAAQVGLAPAEVLITAGSQSALTTIFRALAAPGDAVLVENPTYPGALAALRAAHLVPVPVPADADGVRVEDLEILLVRSGARLVYLQTHVSNPTGASLSSNRRRRLLEVAAERGVLLVDDDWARHMSLDAHLGSVTRTSPPLVSADEHGHVIHLTSLAKPVAPSLRVGFIAARGPALARLHTAAISEHLFTTRLLQEIAVELLTSPDWPRHLRYLSRQLGERCEHLLIELAAHWPSGTSGVHRPGAGHHLWVPCPPGIDAPQLTVAARELGIVVGDGSPYFLDEPTAQRVRMSFGASSQAEVSDAVQRLGRAVSVADAQRRPPSREQTVCR